MKQAYARDRAPSAQSVSINFVAYLPDDEIHDAQKLIINYASFITVGAMNDSEAVSA